MVASVDSVAQLANIAFIRLGFKLTTGSLLDGSDHSNAALNVYAQTRDEMLRQFDYDFAQRTITLTLLKQARAAGYFPPNVWDPATMPPVGFGYEYTYPADCLKVRALVPPPTFVLDMDPQPVDFMEYNDNNYTPPRRTIVCNTASAIAVYTGQVTNPATWDVAFVEAMTAALSRRLAAALVGAQSIPVAGQDEAMETAIAQMDQR